MLPNKVYQSARTVPLLPTPKQVARRPGGLAPAQRRKRLATVGWQVGTGDGGGTAALEGAARPATGRPARRRLLDRTAATRGRAIAGVRLSGPSGVLTRPPAHLRGAVGRLARLPVLLAGTGGRCAGTSGLLPRTGRRRAGVR